MTTNQITAAALLAMLTLTACTSGKPIVPTTADIKACIAEYDARGYMGSRNNYEEGCHQFAAVRTW